MTAHPVMEARCEGATRCMTPRQTCPWPNGFGRNLHSKTRWFMGFCNSHQVSHFAMFFINARANISVAESRFRLQKKHRSPRRMPRTGRKGQVIDSSVPWRFPRRGSLVARRARWARAQGTGGGARARCRSIRPARALLLLNMFTGSFCGAGFDNDPSAGSPTETLLRLLLTLNDKVQWTSCDVAGSEPPTSPRSKHFTGSFNRSKGSLGHTFTVRICTGRQNQMSFYPSVPHEISVLLELMLGHLRYLLTDVPPQQNSPPDNVFRPNRPAERAFCPKRGAVPRFRFTE
ncbi:Regulator of rDNA transcription protein 15 [Capsicum baccatum]|uniref:Regulator of rDNA transcription protein 15 n=1 Tax=Capsicum baccatum TaxID=33114 RepID=A0A2G2V8D8_CAPBA|nr:Regulator of rDNA transcription protein 15 [Capsicum baccatum]